MQEFEKKYDPHVIEPLMQKFWEDNHVYDYKPDKSKPIYSIDTPPPTVSGSLHIGHIFSYTQAEIIARYRRMQGLNVYYPFGFDDNGLPSERLVEKEQNVKAMSVPRAEFIKKCVETTQKYELEFKDLWRSLGFSCDWNLQYNTVNDKVQRISQKLFIDLAKKGHAYTKESPVLWCTECQTSIAQAELETKEIKSSYNYIPFMVGDDMLEVATTRPELLYGVVCLFVNPDDERYKQYVGKMAKVPLYDYEVPVLTDKKAAIDKGTGVVMCATFGDSTDAEWFTEHNLPYRKVLLANGYVDNEVPFIGGLYVKKARKIIINYLKEKGLLLKSEETIHMVATHERCGTEVEIIPSKQWYVKILDKKQELLDAGNRVNWYPLFQKNRFDNWVENLKWDWCISRQRYFGIPFPVWYCADCGKPYFANTSDLPVNPSEEEYNGVCECGSTKFVPEKAVLDTWATSSISPMINKETMEGIDKDDADSFMPMSMRTQAHEIIRTWAFYTITRSLYHNNDIPWKDIMICGYVLAKPGEKISKSKGNAKSSPQALIDEYGADAIRYWSASNKLGTDTFFDERDMKDTSKRLLTKLWNSSKFVLMHLKDFDITYIPQNILPIDRWIIEKTKLTIKQAQDLLDSYEFGLARKVIDGLFWNDLCDNYIEIVKERLYRPDLYGEDNRKSAQYAAFYTLFSILKMYAIYIPHETEYIYQKGFKDFVGELSLHRLTWERVTNVDMDLIEFGKEFTDNIAEVRRIKSTNQLSMKADIDEAIVKGSSRYEEWFKESENDFVSCTHANSVVYALV